MQQTQNPMTNEEGIEAAKNSASKAPLNKPASRKAEAKNFDYKAEKNIKR